MLRPFIFKMEHQQKLPIEKKYSQNWHKYNLAKTHEKRLFYELLYELCQLIEEPFHDNGRPPIPVKDMVFSLGLKLYSNYSGRKVYSDLVHAQGSNYIKHAPHFNTLTNFLNCSATYELLKKILTVSAMPLKELEDDFSMDSSGFGSYQYERWQIAKWKNKRGWRNYLKGHISIGTRTNIICSCEITPGNFSDIKQAPRLLEVTGANFNMKRVSGDKAYLSQRVLKIIDKFNAEPFIPFRVNIKNIGKDSPDSWIKAFNYFKDNKEQFLKHYHKRSNVETTFAMIKVRLGEFLKCKNFVNQRNELVMKFICHNVSCLIQEIYENQIHIDFKKCFSEFVEQKVPDDYPDGAVGDY